MKLLKLSSIIVQWLYSAVCILEAILCLIYQGTDASFSREILSFFMVLLLLPSAFVIPPMITSLVFNVQEVISSYKEKSRTCFLWLAWTILSPIIYFTYSFLACGIFVDVTGGV